MCVLVCVHAYIIVPGDRELSDKSIHDRDIEWLKRADGTLDQ